MKLSPHHLETIEKMIPPQERQAFLDHALEKALADYRAEHAEVIEVYVDGGSRGNPGPSGGGFGLYRGKKLIAKGKEFFGKRTNNQAEYLALRLALREAYDRFPDLGIHCYMDSQLVVEQMKGNYKARNENVRPLYQEVRQIADQFKNFKIDHIPREQNKLADKLANEAMDDGY